MRAKLIGVFGGTFDPVHYGHLKTGRRVLEQTGLDELRLVPCYQPVHRAPAVANAQQRLTMLQLAIEEFPGFIVDDRELRRGGSSYTFDTLEELRRDYPDAVLCLLIGMDAFLGFTTWHRWREILNLAHLLVMARSGYTVSGDVAGLCEIHRLQNAEELRQRKHGGILFVVTPEEDISSTTIRAYLQQGLDVQGLLPAAVERRIREQSLYTLKQPTTSLCN